MEGERISHYVVLEKIGGGGMGVVYKARDEKLQRLVAIKFLSPQLEQTPEEKTRFMHEARAASALEHKNVCTIHEIDDGPDGRTFIVMGYYEGESLSQRLKRGGLALAEAVEIGRQMADGLAAAHARDIVHRDIKPANVMLAADGQAKLVDFGLAKLEGQTKLTQTGSTLGTVAYMAPEQARGEDVDGRADVFSLGVVLYEMVAGQAPFKGSHDVAVLGQVLHSEPDSLSKVQANLPPGLAKLVSDCLAKDGDRRPLASEVAARLVAVSDSLRTPEAAEPASVAVLLRRPTIAVPLGIALVALSAWGFRASQRRADQDWLRQEAIPQIAGLLGQGLHAEAYRLVQEAEARVPEDATVRELALAATVPLSLTTDPPGTAVWYQSYLDSMASWVALGTSPLDVRVPRDYLRFRVEMEGYETLEKGASPWLGSFHASLVRLEDAIPGMVRVPAGTYAELEIAPLDVPAFWIDRYEVTNADYQAFVDQGGYAEASLWPDAVARDFGSWEDGVTELRDATGRAGPSRWGAGRHPDGLEQHPVGGVSWYEAAAYCAFVGKRLPTLHQWKVATGSATDIWAEVTVLSNFGSDGPTPVGASQGLGGHGTYDMAGNVAEWTWTEGRGGTRYTLGGAWGDPEYVYTHAQSWAPELRPPDRGFRCARYDAAPGDPLLSAVDDPVYDFANREVVDDATFTQWETFHEYDPRDLEARVESVIPGLERFDRETVSFTAAYGNERVVAHIFLPRGTEPPYQTIVYRPGITAFLLRSSETIPELNLIDFIPRSGRAFVYPVYAGSYERGFDAPPRGPAERRQRVLMQRQDLMRTVDYLAQRGDIDTERLAYMGLSAGAEYGATYLAVERRFRAAILIGGGYDPTHMQHERPFDVPWNYAPRITLPVLMLNGSRDYAIPVETGQHPLFEDLGTPSEHKRHVVFEGGHIPPQNEIIRETLDWLDRYLGPVGGG